MGMGPRGVRGRGPEGRGRRYPCMGCLRRGARGEVFGEMICFLLPIFMLSVTIKSAFPDKVS